MKKKNVFFLLLIFVLATGLSFAAGGRQPAATGTGPLTSDGRPLITIGMRASPLITDFEDNYLTQFMENKWNVELDFHMLANVGAEANTQIALLVAANSLPDVVISMGMPVAAVLDYGSGGAFQRLNEWFFNPQIAPNFAVIPEQDKQLIITAITMSDGGIYSLPAFEPELGNFTGHRYFINEAWLNRLGLRTPTTTEELRTVLMAFRDRDPNGNGLQDEIPSLGQLNMWGANIVAAFINSFIFYFPGRLSVAATGRTIIAPFTDPEFRRALAYINELHSLLCWVWLLWEVMLLNIENNPNFQEMRIVAPFRGPRGIAYTPQVSYNPAGVAHIAARSGHGELAFRIMENFLDENVSMVARYGIEDYHWGNKPEQLALAIPPNAKAVNLLPPIWPTTHNYHWRNQNPRYARADHVHGNIPQPGAPPYNPMSRSNLIMPFILEHYTPARPEHMIPNLQFTLDETMYLAEAIVTVNQYVSQSTAEFIIGARNINNDAHWNEYLRNLDAMGLQRWISSSQAALERTFR